MRTLLATLFLLTPLTAQAQVETRPTKELLADVLPGQTVELSADTVYVINRMMFVDSLGTLVIEPGTVLKFGTGQDNDADGLVVSRGGKIYAEGTAALPIIMTSVLDDLDAEDGLTYQDRGLWGGVVLLGNASTNNPTPGGLKEVEGVNEIVPAGSRRALYGGTNDDDNSGVFRYVSIRHTGIAVGQAAGNEIQGLTMGGVGRGTVIEYVESYASGDDGFEWFGGTVDARYLVSAFNSDDAFDYDEGWRGRGQFWFAIQAPDAGGRIAEQDGAIEDEFYTPYAIPVIANATYLGPGAGAQMQGDGAEAVIFRDNAGGKYYNAIVTDFTAAAGSFGLTIESNGNAANSLARLNAGDLVLQNMIWYGFGAGNTPQQFVRESGGGKATVVAYLNDAVNANRFVDPMLRGLGREEGARGLDPRPAEGSPALTGARTLTDDWFRPAAYVGAFGEENWLAGWTALDHLGYLSGTGTDVTQVDALPGPVVLQPGYPNPAAATATLGFTLDRAQHVRLSVFDLLGREVAVLVDGVQPAGNLRATLDVSALAPGTYVYRLAAEAITQSRTLTVVR